MATVFDVAKYFLEKLGGLSTWKLQKLCYYAQAWHFTWTDKALFNEDFQAWTNGPVCKELYEKHKGEYSITADFLEKGDTSVFNDDELESLDIILKDYGNKESWWLREQTHSEAPWEDARIGVPEKERSENIITKESMARYYGSL